MVWIACGLLEHECNGHGITHLLYEKQGSHANMDIGNHGCIDHYANPDKLRSAWSCRYQVLNALDPSRNVWIILYHIVGLRVWEAQSPIQEVSEEGAAWNPIQEGAAWHPIQEVPIRSEWLYRCHILNAPELPQRQMILDLV